MITAFKAELRKLLTVRSTYVIVGVSLLLVAFFSFYAVGWRAVAGTALRDDLLGQHILQAVQAVALLGSLVGVLLVTHEYRYNTIVYTLTAARSRSAVFFAKLLAASVFSCVFVLLIAFVAPLLVKAGMAAHGLHLVPQSLDLPMIFWKVIFLGWGYGMLSFIIAMIIRVQVGAVAAMLLAPAMVEQLLALALKRDAIYLPYSALQSVMQHDPDLKVITPQVAVSVVLGYVIVGSIAAWWLFVRRDAR